LSDDVQDKKKDLLQLLPVADKSHLKGQTLCFSTHGQWHSRRTRSRYGHVRRYLRGTAFDLELRRL